MSPPDLSTRVGIVLIGRNEGERLVRGIEAALAVVPRVVYVDSGSSDDSVATARALGVKVIELDDSRPHSAARGRNAGARALLAETPPDYILFIDGDCALQEGFVEAAAAALDADPKLGLVTGWVSEIHPEASIYNALCDVEWHGPAGQITTCGGNMAVRREAFEAVGGFNDTVIAAEDDDFCLRLAAAGWSLERLPVAMACHDAAITRFSQFWKRAVRAGHCYAQVGALHPGYFAGARRRSYAYGLVLPVLGLAGLATNSWLLAAVACIYGLNYAKTVRGLRKEGVRRDLSFRLGGLLSISKFANLQGMIAYYRRASRTNNITIIEYK